MATSDTTPHDAAEQPLVGSGWLTFAGLLIMLLGVFKIAEGLFLLWNEHYRAAINLALYVFNLGAWGWIYLLLGLLMIAVGAGVLAGQEWARAAGVGLAAAVAVLQLIYLPFGYATLINIALAVLVIYALVVPPRHAIGN